MREIEDKMGRMDAVTRVLLATLIVLVIADRGASADENVDPVADLKAYQNSISAGISGVKLNDFANGPYTMDEGMHKQWEEIMQFPPMTSRSTRARSCSRSHSQMARPTAIAFRTKGLGSVRTILILTPKRGEVVTLELAINECRVANLRSRFPGRLANLRQFPLTWPSLREANRSTSRSRTTRGACGL